MSSVQNAVEQQGTCQWVTNSTRPIPAHPREYCWSLINESRLLISSDNDWLPHAFSWSSADSKQNSSGDSPSEPRESLVTLRTQNDTDVSEHTIKIHPLQWDRWIVRYSVDLNCNYSNPMTQWTGWATAPHSKDVAHGAAGSPKRARSPHMCVPTGWLDTPDTVRDI